MLNRTAMDSETPAPAPAPAIRAVADDMTAIFGATHRGDLPNDRAPALVPQRRHRAWRALVAVGGVATMITAGLIGGSAVLDSGAAPAQRAAPKRIATRPAAAPTVAPVMVAAATVPTPTPGDTAEAQDYRGDTEDRGDTGYRGDADDRAGADYRVDSAPADGATPAPPAAAARQTARADERPIVVPRPRRAERPVAIDRAPPALYAARTCYDEASCLAPQLQAAERTVAVAYDRATAAQVRNGTLRDYRDEWLRARRVSQRRPREALRIYGMIAADLQLYADNAPGDDRMAWR